METLQSSLAGDDAVESLRAFIKEYSSKFKFPNDASTRRSLAAALMKYLSRSDLEVDHQCLALEALRILCREPTGLQPLSSTEGLVQLLALAGVVTNTPAEEKAPPLAEVASPSTRDWRTAIEATKCLCNLTFNVHEVAARMVNDLHVIQPLVARLGDASATDDALFYLTRLLFLVSGLHRPAISQIREKGGLVCLVKRLNTCIHAEKNENGILKLAGDGSLLPLERRLAAELFKVLFSVTMLDVKCSEEESLALIDLFSMVRLLLVCQAALNGEEGENLSMQLVYLLVNLPERCGASLAPSTVLVESTGEVVVFEGHDVTALQCMFGVLRQRLEELGIGSLSSKGDKLVGVISAMSRCARCSRIARRYWCKTLLPPLTQVTHRPEEGDTLKARLVRLMTSPHSTVTKTVTDFLFVLCKENASRFVKHTGYGNAAGLLMQRGLLNGGGLSDEASATGYSSDSDIDEGPEVDPVTGGPPRPPTLDDMTEEEKEEEAEKLVHLFERLEKTGVVKVLRQNKTS